MRYKCGDGIDRDKWIKKTLELESLRDTLKIHIQRDTDSLESVQRKLGDISFNYLGHFGQDALEKARK